MKKIIFLFLLISRGFVFAGPSTSGGGFAVVCRGLRGVIQSAKLIDLYEAQTKYGYQLMPASGDFAHDYVRAARNIYRLQGYNPPVTDDEIKTRLGDFMKIVQWVPPGEKLPNLNDLGGQIAVPKGCDLEPLAIFYDRQNIVSIDKEIWDSLDSQSQAGLIVHELGYHYMRQMAVNPDTNSKDVRLFSASYFAQNLIPVQSGIPSNAKVESRFHKCNKTSPTSSSCEQATTYHRFNMTTNNGKNYHRIQFTFLAGRPLASITILDLPMFVSQGEVFPIRSAQLIGWMAEVVKEQSASGQGSTKLLIKRGQELMVELPL